MACSITCGNRPVVSYTGTTAGNASPTPLL